MKYRVFRSIIYSIFIAAILSSCGGLPIPGVPTATPVPPSPTPYQQALPPSLVETEPLDHTVIGHLSPLTFYFNEAMDKASVETAFRGLPEGTFTWNDEATVVFKPSQPYAPNSELPVTIASSIKSSTGFGIQESIDLSFAVADYLRPTNILPQEGASDADVQSAVVVSFNQPVVPLGAENTSTPPAFSLQPSVPGDGEWINTSTYIFYPDPAMAGGTEYTISLNADLKTETGVGLDGSVPSQWKFATALPGVVSIEPTAEQRLPLDPQIKLTFNQPMDTRSVEQNFVFSGPEGPVNGRFDWSEDDSVLHFEPQRELVRNAGYILSLDGKAESEGGMVLGNDYGEVFNTFDNFAVTGTSVESSYAVFFTFSSPLPQGDYNDFVKVSPALENFSTGLTEDGLTLGVYGFFEPETNYSIEIAAQLRDTWKQSLGDPYIFNFRTAPAQAMLNVNAYNSSTAFVRPDDPALYAKAVNVQSADVTVSPITLQEYLLLVNSYENQQAFNPSNSMVYPHTFNLPASKTEDVRLRLSQEGTPLLPNLYFVEVSSPQIESPGRTIYFAVSSQVNLTFKLGATEALVWAMDLTSQSPVANAPISIYDNNGNLMVSGSTDEQGLWKGPLNPPFNPQEGPVLAVLGDAGSENFAVATSSWNLGVAAWDFGYSFNKEPPHTHIYMYSDRPIYRPGQTVYFRGVARQAFNGRYELPQVNEVPLTLRDANGTQLLSLNAPLSPYGTFNGEYQLPADAVPGYYIFENPDLNLWFSFQVAEYRKPEINLTVDFSADEIKLGDEASVTVSARYFFDAPVNDMEVHWVLSSRPDPFYFPNYDTGMMNTSWLDAFNTPGFFGAMIEEGSGRTDRDGLLTVKLPDIPKQETGQILTLEVTTQDESGLPVSARSEIKVHPADFYIGIRPDQWIGRADAPIGFEVYTVDWAQNALGGKTLDAEFKQVRWEKETNSAGFPTFTPVYEPASSSNLTTGPDGKARLSFVPPTAGTYMLDISGEGTRTQSLIWVGGASSAAWPDLPNQRIEISADRESYKAGDTAKLFIPNPFAVNAQALVTVERGVISKAEIITISGSGREYSLPLTEADAPNVYVSVIMLGQGNDFRGGLINLPVAPDDKELNVAITTNPDEAGPRQDVTFDLQVTDDQGQPVEGEFSLAVVDQASLALADPNSQDILTAYYSNQPLGVETGLSIAVYSGRDVLMPGGGGGGGGGEVPFIREEFPDTAYWNPTLVTNAEGHGQVTLTLPDSLTTWQVDVRGLTVDTRVGETNTQIVATKPMLVRPVTPRFLVNGDHVLMAAIVNNNTSNRLRADVSLQSEGFILDDPDKATQQVEIPASGRTRVEWWGTASFAEAADLVFSAKSTGTPTLEDSTRPSWGKLPILQYSAPQAFVTGGILRGAASVQEVISLPRTFTPNGGGLDVELNPSLAGSLLSALAEMDQADTSSAESITSYYLPNLEVYQSLSGAGLNDPALTDRVAATVDSSVHTVLRLQNEDAGWNWWGSTPPGSQTTPSDPYISAYVTFGLIRAHRAGVSVDETALQRAGSYLRDLKHEVTSDTSGAELDEITFIQFVLAQAATYDEQTINNLYNARDRMSPSSQALLASIINAINPADERARDLTSNLETNAIVTASSAHWETPPANRISRGSPVYTTSLVVYVLSQLDPANQVLFNAVNYLSAHRGANGLWNNGHDNAWALLALNQAMLGFGDLSADFKFDATFNGGPLITGEVAGSQVLTSSTAQVPLEYISPSTPNLLTIQRTDGLGRLYYHGVLNVNRPVEEVKPLDAGLRIERTYCETDTKKGCTPLTSLQLEEDQTITAQLTLVVPNDSYYVMAEDFIPAGMEILNRNLKSSQQGMESTEVEVQFDDKDPFAEGWGWWLFHDPQIRDDSILFSADYLPAGTYVLTYILVPLQAGEYRVLPAHAWQSFFPEVQGTSAGAVFEIKP